MVFVMNFLTGTRWRTPALLLSFALTAYLFLPGAWFVLLLAPLLALISVARLRNGWKIAAGALLVALMVFFKWPHQALPGDRLIPFLVGVPLGFSFVFFSALSLWMDQRRGGVPENLRFTEACAVLLLAPALIIGPFIRARDSVAALRSHSDVSGSFGFGFLLISWGVAKKCLADALRSGLLKDAFIPLQGEGAIAGVTLLLFCATLYLDFSGYSDAARGFARALGLDLPENFRQPYLARDFSDFWTRWHRSLGEWFKEYVFTPGLFRYQAFRARISPRLYAWGLAAIVAALVALWHGIGWNFALWFLVTALGLGFRPALGSYLRPLQKQMLWLFGFVMIFVTQTLLMSRDLTEWGGLWMSASSGSWSFSGLIHFAALAGALFLVQLPHHDHFLKFQNAHLWRQALAIVALWFVSFCLATGGEAFIYAGF
jgi:alginate O-acetyltransferase complex protein AlgI